MRPLEKGIFGTPPVGMEDSEDIPLGEVACREREKEKERRNKDLVERCWQEMHRIIEAGNKGGVSPTPQRTLKDLKVKKMGAGGGGSKKGEAQEKQDQVERSHREVVEEVELLKRRQYQVLQLQVHQWERKRRENIGLAPEH